GRSEAFLRTHRVVIGACGDERTWTRRIEDDNETFGRRGAVREARVKVHELAGRDELRREIDGERRTSPRVRSGGDGCRGDGRERHERAGCEDDTDPAVATWETAVCHRVLLSLPPMARRPEDHASRR